MLETWRARLMLAMGLIGAVAIISAQSWQLSDKRGRVGKTRAEYVTYEDLDATVTALQQYSNMHDMQLAKIDERQQEVLRRLAIIDLIKVESRLQVIEEQMDSMQWWHHAIAGGVIVSLIGIATSLFFHVRPFKGGL